MKSIDQMELEPLELDAQKSYNKSGWYLEAGETYRFYSVEKRPLV